MELDKEPWKVKNKISASQKQENQVEDTEDSEKASLEKKKHSYS